MSSQFQQGLPTPSVPLHPPISWSVETVLTYYFTIVVSFVVCRGPWLVVAPSKLWRLGFT